MVAARGQGRRLRTTAAWLVVAAAGACGGAPERPKPPTFVQRLHQLGFYAYADPARLAALQQEGEAAGFAAIYADTGRYFRFPAQAIADGGVGRFLDELRPFLSGQKVEVDVEDSVADEGYTATINGRAHEIWTAAELEKEAAEEREGLLAALASARAIKAVNDLLQQAGSRERLYAVRSGDDLGCLFLTPSLWQIVQEQVQVPAAEKPYVPAEEYARFAQPPR